MLRISLETLVKVLPRPAALIDKDYNLLLANQAFDSVFDKLFGSIINASGITTDIINLFGLTSPGWRSTEISLTKGNEHKIYWCEVYTLSIPDTYLHLLHMHDMTQVRTLEDAYLHAIKKMPDDNLWICASDTTLLFVPTNSKRLKTFIGKQAKELILIEDWAIWNQAITQAKTKPSNIINVVIRSKIDGLPRMVDLRYLPGELFGGRFYAATRSIEPTGSRIIRRLKEAWMVRTDGALAKALGTAKSAVSKASNQEAVPPSWIIRTGSRTGTSLDWLMWGIGDKHLQ